MKSIPVMRIFFEAFGATVGLKAIAVGKKNGKSATDVAEEALTEEILIKLGYYRTPLRCDNGC